MVKWFHVTYPWFKRFSLLIPVIFWTFCLSPFHISALSKWCNYCWFKSIKVGVCTWGMMTASIWVCVYVCVYNVHATYVRVHEVWWQPLSGLVYVCTHVQCTLHMCTCTWGMMTASIWSLPARKQFHLWGLKIKIQLRLPPGSRLIAKHKWLGSKVGWVDFDHK